MESIEPININQEEITMLGSSLNETPSQQISPDNNQEGTEDMIDFSKKKRPKKKTEIRDQLIQEIPQEEDYTYDFMIKRIYSMMTPSENTHKLRLVPPVVGMIGGKRCCISNFGQICEGMNRDYNHVSQYIAIEFSTVVSMNPDHKLILRGKYRTENIQTGLRSYIKKYVICDACKCYNTVLIKEDRVHFLKCNDCQSRRPVEPLRNNRKVSEN